MIMIFCSKFTYERAFQLEEFLGLYDDVIIQGPEYYETLTLCQSPKGLEGELKLYQSLIEENRPKLIIEFDSPLVQILAEKHRTFCLSLRHPGSFPYFNWGLHEQEPDHGLTHGLWVWKQRKFIHKELNKIRSQLNLSERADFFTHLESPFNFILSTPHFANKNKFRNNTDFLGPLYLKKGIQEEDLKKYPQQSLGLYCLNRDFVQKVEALLPEKKVFQLEGHKDFETFLPSSGAVIIPCHLDLIFHCLNEAIPFAMVPLNPWQVQQANLIHKMGWGHILPQSPNNNDLTNFLQCFDDTNYLTMLQNLSLSMNVEKSILRLKRMIENIVKKKYYLKSIFS